VNREKRERERKEQGKAKKEEKIYELKSFHFRPSMILWYARDSHQLKIAFSFYKDRVSECERCINFNHMPNLMKI
jgi:hypothetical protein